MQTRLIMLNLGQKPVLLFRLLLKKLLEDDENGHNECCDDDAVLRGKQ